MLKKLFAAIIALALLCSLALPVSASEVVLPSGIGEEAIGEAIEDFVQDHEDTMAGLSVSVFRKDSVLYRNYFGYADKENRIPVDKNTVMEWGSATKLLVWVSAMQLWEQDKLDLEADIRTYLPKDFLRNLKYDEPITMLHLMNHNAGFEDSIVGMMTADESQILSLETYLRTIQPQQVFAPGEITAYSNWGVALAGYIVERISGMPFYEYARTHIFTPLGMEHSALNAGLSDNDWVKQQRKNLECYTTDAERIPNCRHHIIMYPAGMCTSTLEDFETFAMALLDRESPLFADPATYDVFVSPSDYFGDTDIPLNHHGMWAEAYYSTHVIGHGGNTIGCSARLLLDLGSGVGMVVMTNQSGEMVFNYDLPELVFGECGYESLDFTGHMYSCRTTFHGPLKLNRLLSTYSVTPAGFEGTLYVLSESNGVTKITATGGGGDYIVTTLPEILLFSLPVILWAAALLFCLLSLMVRSIYRLVRKLRHRPVRIPPQRWATLACILQPLAVLPIIPVILTLTSGNQWPVWVYRAVFGSYLIYAAVFAVLAVHGIVKMCRQKRWNFFGTATVIALLISVFNIFYWELGYFWML